MECVKYTTFAKMNDDLVIFLKLPPNCNRAILLKKSYYELLCLNECEISLNYLGLFPLLLNRPKYIKFEFENHFVFLVKVKYGKYLQINLKYEHNHTVINYVGLLWIQNIDKYVLENCFNAY